LHRLGAALGPPPEGIFSSDQFPRQCADIGTENLLTNIALPVGRACLEALRQLSLKCLSWEPAGRPTAQACLDSIEQWLSTTDPAPNFADLWFQHAAVLPGEPPGAALPLQKPTDEDRTAYEGLLETAAVAMTTSAQKSESQADSDPRARLESTTGNSNKPKHKPNTPSPPEVPGQCGCTRSHCGRHKGPCPNTAVESSSFNFCSTCTCQEPDCGGMQLNRSGYCYNHIWRTSPPELQLLRALGAAVSPASLLQEICPANLQVFRRVCGDYIVKFQELDPVFELVAAWLDHPWWMEAWSDNKLPPNSCPDALVSALHRTIRQMSNRQSLELDSEEPPRGGLGYLPCCSWLGVIEVTSPGAVLPASEDLVLNVGREKQTWHLIKAASACIFFKYSCEFKMGSTAFIYRFIFETNA
jgi:hypothetical protein